MSAVLFFIAGIGAIAGAIGVITLRNPFYTVLALVFHLLSLATLFLLLEAQFVAAAQVIVYAGAGWRPTRRSTRGASSPGSRRPAPARWSRAPAAWPRCR